VQPFFFSILAGLTALAFLVVVWRRRQMPVLLRAILIIAAVAIVGYVFWSLALTSKP
jgi:heme/copper-type cytochrome/quinol oxidase subunit 4